MRLHGLLLLATPCWPPKCEFPHTHTLMATEKGNSISSTFLLVMQSDKRINGSHSDTAVNNTDRGIPGNDGIRYVLKITTTWKILCHGWFIHFRLDGALGHFAIACSGKKIILSEAPWLNWSYSFNGVGESWFVWYFPSDWYYEKLANLLLSVMTGISRTTKKRLDEPPTKWA